MRRKAWVCVTTLYYSDFFLFFYYFVSMDSRYWKFLSTKQTASFQNDSSSHFKIKSYKMPIKVLAGKNQLLTQWVAITPKFTMTENSLGCQLLPPQTRTCPGVHLGAHYATLGTIFRDTSSPGLATGSDPLPRAIILKTWILPPKSSFAKLIQLLLNAYITTFNLYLENWVGHRF